MKRATMGLCPAPRGLRLALYMAAHVWLRLATRATPWRWLVEATGWRRRWAVWIYAREWYLGERLEGRI